METIFVRYDEYIKKIIGIQDNEIDLWWNEIINYMPGNLQIEAKKISCSLKEDSNFDFNSSLGQKYMIEVPFNNEIQKFINEKGPFYIIVGAT